MSFFIGKQKISKISGPVSLTILTPTDAFCNVMWDASPVLMLIGDNHSAMEPRCDESEKHVKDMYEAKEGLVFNWASYTHCVIFY
jgi:hypothetical protein